MKRYKLKKDMPNIKAGDIVKIHILKDDPVIVRDIDEQYKLGDYFPVEQLLLEFGILEEIPDKPKTVWDLKKGDKIYEITHGVYGWEVVEDEFLSCHEYRKEDGSIFASHEDATTQMTINLAIQKIKKYIHDNDMEFVPDWDDDGQAKYIVYYLHDDNNRGDFCAASMYTYQEQEKVLPYLGSMEDAKKIIANCREELKIIFNIKK